MSYAGAVISALALSGLLGPSRLDLLAQSSELPPNFSAIVGDLGKTLQWRPIKTLYRATSAKSEEIRIWFGFGEDWPNPVLRLRRSSDSVLGELAFWWHKGQYARSIRESLTDGTTCSHKGKGKRVETCHLTMQRDWVAIWDSLQIRQIPTLAQEVHAESNAWIPERFDMAVEYWSGDSHLASVHRLDPQEPHGQRLACALRAVLVPNEEMPKELRC